MNVDYVIADLWQLKKYQIAFKEERKGLKEIVNMINKITTAHEYGIIGFKDGVILMQKGVTSELQAKAVWLGFQREIQLR